MNLIFLYGNKFVFFSFGSIISKPAHPQTAISCDRRQDRCRSRCQLIALAPTMSTTQGDRQNCPAQYRGKQCYEGIRSVDQVTFVEGRTFIKSNVEPSRCQMEWSQISIRADEGPIVCCHDYIMIGICDPTLLLKIEDIDSVTRQVLGNHIWCRWGRRRGDLSSKSKGNYVITSAEMPGLAEGIGSTIKWVRLALEYNVF
mmetsp:Transcript_31784/g.53614  ORF Transcript_31784/g.53614 Transcript_31784/m.53614 type:complete len:200 (-) Transcript_31784:1440-2039(-)